MFCCSECRQAVNNTMQKFGLKTTKSKRARREAEAEEEAEAALQFKVRAPANTSTHRCQGLHGCQFFPCCFCTLLLELPHQGIWSTLQDGLNVVSEARVAGEDLQGRHKRRKNKEERMQSVLEGMHLLSVLSLAEAQCQQGLHLCLCSCRVAPISYRAC